MLFQRYGDNIPFGILDDLEAFRLMLTSLGASATGMNWNRIGTKLSLL